MRALIAALFALLVAASACAQDYEPKFGQAGKDVVWLPMPDEQVERLLDLAKVTPADFVMDLGSGDGRMVIAAAKRGARALGVEFNPELVEYSKHQAEKAGVAVRAQFVQGDLFKADLSQATVITLFLLQQMNVKLRPQILALKPGTRVVANTFHMGDWQPDASEHSSPDCEAWCTLFLWIVPARVEGVWQTTLGPLAIKQRFQELSGTLGNGVAAMPLAGRMEGNRMRFTAGGSRYAGTVNGKTMEGTVETGNGLRSWRAER